MNEEDNRPFQVAVYYMHKLLNDPSRVVEYVDNPEQAAELILSTLDSYQIPYELDKETILSAFPKRKYRKTKTIKWTFLEGTRDHIEVIVYDFRPYHGNSKFATLKF